MVLDRNFFLSSSGPKALTCPLAPKASTKVFSSKGFAQFVKRRVSCSKYTNLVYFLWGPWALHMGFYIFFSNFFALRRPSGHAPSSPAKSPSGACSSVGHSLTLSVRSLLESHVAHSPFWPFFVESKKKHSWFYLFLSHRICVSLRPLLKFICP